MRRRNIMWTLLILAAVAGTACIGGADGVLKCKEDQECHENYRCDINTTVNSQVCLRGCTVATEATDCLSSQSCDVAPADTDGFCRESTSSGGDPTGGDPTAGDPAGDPAGD